MVIVITTYWLIHGGSKVPLCLLSWHGSSPTLLLLYFLQILIDFEKIFTSDLSSINTIASHKNLRFSKSSNFIWKFQKISKIFGILLLFPETVGWWVIA